MTILVKAARIISRAKRVDGRVTLALGLALFFVFVLASPTTSGVHTGFQKIGVPILSPSFADLRGISSAWDCAEQGIDVFVENPCDPWGRPHIYPRVWIGLRHLGLDQSATVPLALGMICIFLVALFLAIGRLTFGQSIVYVLVVISPATMLGIERANVDLLMFAAVAFAGMTFRSRRRWVRWTAHGLVVVSTMLKLHPAFSAAAFLRQKSRRLLFSLATIGLPVCVFLALTLSDLRLISRGIPRVSTGAFGSWVSAQKIQLHLGVSDRFGDALQAMIVLGGLIAAAILARAIKGDSISMPEGRVDLFWVGGAIYVGTYVWGVNFDYRLIFLLLTLPLLVNSIRRPGRFTPIAPWLLLGIVGTFWLSRFLEPWDEFVNWALFAAISAILIVTTPRPLWHDSKADRKKALEPVVDSP